MNADKENSKPALKKARTEEPNLTESSTKENYQHARRTLDLSGDNTLKPKTK